MSQQFQWPREFSFLALRQQPEVARYKLATSTRSYCPTLLVPQFHFVFRQKAPLKNGADLSKNHFLQQGDFFQSQWLRSKRALHDWHLLAIESSRRSISLTRLRCSHPPTSSPICDTSSMALSHWQLRMISKGPFFGALIQNQAFFNQILDVFVSHLLDLMNASFFLLHLFPAIDFD